MPTVQTFAVRETDGHRQTFAVRETEVPHYAERRQSLGQQMLERRAKMG